MKNPATGVKGRGVESVGYQLMKSAESKKKNKHAYAQTDFRLPHFCFLLAL